MVTAQGRRRFVLLVPPLLTLIVMACLWFALDLSSLRSLDQLLSALERVRVDPDAPAYVIGGFALLPVLFFPITALIVATALTFGPLRGFSYAMSGLFVGAVTTYWTGRLVGAHALSQLMGPRFFRIAELLRTHAFRASVLARLAPVGNFSAMNMLAGAVRIPFLTFMAGTTLGAAPGTLLISVFSERAAHMVRTQSASDAILLIAAVLAVVGIGFWVRQRLSRGRVRE